VRIGGGQDSTAGAIVGGEAWARGGIRVAVAGSRRGQPTSLSGGLDPQQGQRLDKLGEDLATSYKQLLRYLERFGLERPDLVQIRSLIQAATGPRRKLLESSAQRLAKLARLYRSLSQVRHGLLEQIREQAETCGIQISTCLHPGVEIRIGDQRRASAPRALSGPLLFRLVDGALVERRPAADGTAADGAAATGTAADGTAADGAAVDGAAVDGAATDGAAADGSDGRVTGPPGAQ
jgi:hypothetical protein